MTRVVASGASSVSPDTQSTVGNGLPKLTRSAGLPEVRRTLSAFQRPARMLYPVGEVALIRAR